MHTYIPISKGAASQATGEVAVKRCSLITANNNQRPKSHFVCSLTKAQKRQAEMSQPTSGIQRRAWIITHSSEAAHAQLPNLRPEYKPTLLESRERIRHTTNITKRCSDSGGTSLTKVNGGSSVTSVSRQPRGADTATPNHAADAQPRLQEEVGGRTSETRSPPPDITWHSTAQYARCNRIIAANPSVFNGWGAKERVYTTIPTDPIRTQQHGWRRAVSSYHNMNEKTTNNVLIELKVSVFK